MENKFQTSDFSFLISEIFTEVVGRTNLFTALKNANNHAKELSPNKESDIIKLSGFEFNVEKTQETQTYLFIEFNPDGVKSSDYSESKKRIMGLFGGGDCVEYDLNGDLGEVKPIGGYRLFMPVEDKWTNAGLVSRKLYKFILMVIASYFTERRIVGCARKLGLEAVVSPSVTEFDKIELKTKNLILETRSVTLDDQETESEGKVEKKVSFKDRADIGAAYVNSYIYRTAANIEIKIEKILKAIPDETLEVLKNEGYVKDKVNQKDWELYQKALLAYIELHALYKNVSKELSSSKNMLKFRLDEYYEEVKKNNKQ